MTPVDPKRQPRNTAGMALESKVPEMTPAELVRAVETGREIAVLDVRAPFRLEGGRIDIVPDDRFFNIKGSELLAMEDPAAAGLDAARPVAVVCGLGNDSRRIAAWLNERGYSASSVRGGMVAWMDMAVRRTLKPPPELDVLLQMDRVGKGALGYLMVSDGEAMVIDPPRHPLAYLEAIDDLGATLVAVADTHAHADYISGGPALATAHEVPYLLHPADAVYPFDGTPGKVRFEELEDGQVLRVGRAEVTVLHTPGHTEGHCCFRVGTAFALTGDFVFVGSVGRPDLGGKAAPWTKVLWQSLQRARATWPAGMMVYPAHYAAAEERNADHTVGAPFGPLPSRNEPLAIKDEKAFTDWVMSRVGEAPDAYRRIKAINLGLEKVTEPEAEELDAGKNQCALG